MMFLHLMLLMTSFYLVQTNGYGIGGMLRRNLFQQQQNANHPQLNNLTLNNSVQSFRGSDGEYVEESDTFSRDDTYATEEFVDQSKDTAIASAIIHDNAEDAESLDDEHSGVTGVSEVQVEEQKGSHLIPFADIEQAFEESLAIIQKNNDAIVKAGWKLVHENELYTLFKRRGKDENGREEKGPVEYMMKGIVDDVSPRLFLHAQTNKELRQGWDKTMSDMETDLDNPHSLDKYVLEGEEESEDTLYYRTKWPWPLKDRDYTLARRVQFKRDPGKEAVVFVSKATGELDVPKKDGVIRVDNYWCRSAYFATQQFPAILSESSTHINKDRMHNVEASGSDGKHRVHLEGVSTNDVLNTTFDEESHTHGPSTDVRHRLNNMFSKSKLNLDKNLFEKMKVPRLKKMLSGAGADDQRRGGSGERKRKKGTGSYAYDLKGTQFVTIFCDDSKVPLPSRVVDMISTQAEKVVPDSMRSLHKAATSLQKH
jgi:hypothetical protein